MTDNKVWYSGRPDGIGNRIEQLIRIQEYCTENKLQCNYIWNNSYRRTYSPLISFDNIEIVNAEDLKKSTKAILIKRIINARNADFRPRYKFDFNINSDIEYDTIIHVRATDRLTSFQKHGDFSIVNELDMFIDRMINYVNNDSEINTYTVISDDEKYIDIIKNRISKTFVALSYDYDTPNEWLDYYYLTKTKKNIIMCCKFSSYSITASILANKTLLCFKQSLESSLPRYKANIQLID